MIPGVVVTVAIAAGLGFWCGWVFGRARGYRERGAVHVADLRANLESVQTIIGALKASRRPGVAS